MAFLEKTNTIMMSALNFFRRQDQTGSQHLGRKEVEKLSSPLLPFPPIKVYIYGPSIYMVLEPSNLEDLWKIIGEYKDKNKLWIDIEGRGDAEFLQSIGSYFGLHELEMEDIANVHQRPKVEIYGEHLFVISRMIYFSKIFNSLINEQVAFFVFDNLLLTMQEDYEDSFNGVREKLKKNYMLLCEGNTFFLAWALIDAIIDQYFVILEGVEQRLAIIDNQLLENPRKIHLLEIQSLKREVMFLRKAILAERDKLAEIERHDFTLIDDKIRVYLRDTYDHTAQIVDILESQKEISYSLMEIYLGTQNNKMSEVMKVLTVISSIFIPLTFIVGVYGMNFSSTDIHGQSLPLNMPELTSPYGYVYVMVFMLIIAVAQVLFFKRRGWL